MTTQDIIRQTKEFTAEQKQELAYYFLLSIISEDKKQKFKNLFHYKNNVSEIKKDTDTIVTEQFLSGYSEEDDIYNSL